MMKVRIFLTAVVGVLAGLVGNVIRVAAPLVTGNAAADQLENSDAAYVQTSLIMNHFGAVASFWVIFIMALVVAIWIKPLKAYYTKKKATNIGSTAAMIFLVIGALTCAAPSFAYYDVKNNPEFIDIQPNQSAFLIPMVGANKDSQKKYMSSAYLDENKVAAKRVQIPHTTLHKVGLQRDVYIPSAKLFIVDRTPYNRNWVGAKDRGTSGKDEAIRFESNESIDGHTGVVVSAYVKEDDVSKFLYYFGTKPAGQGDAGAYASVVYGTSLAEVMDVNVYNKVQSVMAREFGKHSVRDCIRHKADIMATTLQEVRDTYGPKGITIDFIGYAEGLTWNNADVQKAMDSVFVSNMEVEAYPARLKMLQIKKIEADINLKNSYAEAVKKWNGVIPSWFCIPDKVWNMILGIFHQGK